MNNQDILREQDVLRELEQKLQTALAKVYENINALKVEEFELKSNAIRKEFPHKTQAVSTERNLNNLDEEPVTIDDPENINKQPLDLELLIKKFEEEDDDCNE